MKTETAQEDDSEAPEHYTGRRQRIAICADARNFGGLEKFVLVLSQHLHAGGAIDPVVIVFHEAELASALRALGVQTIALPFASKHVLIRELCRTFASHAIDLVHTHGYKATILGAAAAKLCRLPVIETRHGIAEPQRGWDHVKLRCNYCINRWATRLLVDKVIYVTHDLRDRESGVDGSVIHNGLSVDSVRRGSCRPSELGQPGFHIGIVGRLEVVKGHRVLLDAVATSRYRHAIHVHLWGVGPLEEELQDLSRRHGLTANVHFHGFRPNIADYVGWLDAFIMPSLYEGLPFALLEAMLLRRPIVASRVGGLEEALEDGRSALLFEPGDSAELALAIDRLIEDRELCERLGAGAYDRVSERFGVHRMIEQYHAVFESACSARPVIEWVSWDRHRRTMQLADALGIPVRVIPRGRLPGLGRVAAWFRTVLHLCSTRSRVVIVPNPSLLLTATACFLKPFKKYRIIQDLHSYFYETLTKPRGVTERLYAVLSRYCIRRTDLTVVTNEHLQLVTTRLGGRALVLQDRIPEISSARSAPLAGRVNIVFISTYSDDEPIAEVLRAAKSISSDIHVYVTGRMPRAARHWAVPQNVHLTGYLREDEYAQLLSSADAILALTTRDHTLLCAAYEAVALGKPLVMSDTSALRAYFTKGVIFTGNDSTALVAALEDVGKRLEILRTDIAKLRVDLAEPWQRRFSDVRGTVAQLAGQSAERGSA
jgi:glycosyltransferase involved in cell wall biosynthesis